MNNPLKIGFIGCGKIAEPMVRSLCRRYPDSEISASKRTEVVSTRLCNEFQNVSVGENQWVLDQSDIIFICVLAGVAKSDFPGLSFKPDHQVISVMADISLEEVSQLIAPAKNPCVTIPLPFIDTGGCPLPVYPQSKILEQLFRDENEIITVNHESAMGPHFAATAILSTLMAQLDCVSKWLGEKSGSAINGEIYTATLVSGYLNSLRKDGAERFLEAMHDLSTEGGLNTQLLNHNKDSGMLDVLKDGLEKLGERLKASI